MRLDESRLVEWGARVGETIDPPVFIGLSGRLGAGKSVLARAIGTGAGVATAMPSPSFTLMSRYPAARGRQVVHIDLYRIESPDELAELGWTQLGEDDEVVLVEWPERAGDLMPRDHWLIELTTPTGHPDLRDVEVRRAGAPAALAAFPMSVTGA